MKTSLLLAAVLALIVLPALADPVGEPAPVPFKVATVPYAVGPLDIITFTQADKTVDSVTVSQDGKITLDDEEVTVKGLTPDALQALLHKRVKGASAIHIEEFRPHRITVLGEVFHQIYSEMSDGPMRVLDAIASANGFTSLANTRRVKLVRENAGTIEVYELDLRAVMRGLDSGQNMPLKPGDVITVPRNFL